MTFTVFKHVKEAWEMIKFGLIVLTLPLTLWETLILVMYARAEE